ncbi:MAG: NOP58 family protein [Candidatus Micrarchaeota archaeon]|nr:NOP58 family protein [Candidatus Micrarchaeota archaeon]
MADSFEKARERMLKGTRAEIKETYSNEEHALMQAINAYLDTSKSFNLAFERLSEWFGIYYPEVKVQNPLTLARLAHIIDAGISEESVKAAVGDAKTGDEIFKEMSSAMGRKPNDDEKRAVSIFAETCLHLANSLEYMDAYLKVAAERILPNTTYLTDEKIAAELLAKAGSLERLATMPASTIQLLGAEKALFKHIKFGSKPPKYGVLFKLQEVSGAPKEMRGRIARAYATKISIGLKGDFYSKRFIAEKLKADLQKSIEKIKASPPREKKPEPPQERRQFRRPGFQQRQQHGRPQGGRGRNSGRGGARFRNSA